MFLKKNKKNLRSLFNLFAVLGLAITALLWGANTSTINAQVVRGTLFDFTGEGRTDFTTLTGSPSGNITWNIVANPVNPLPNQGIIRRFNFGFLADTAQGRLQDVIVPADYVGDRKTEIAVYRRSNSVYYLAQFPTAPNTGITLDRAVPFGSSGDLLGGEGDYDGDGKDDYTVVRPVSGTYNWLILSSGTNTFKQIPFGRTGVAGFTGTNFFRGADFTGDGRDELIVVNNNSAAPRTVNYFIGDSNTGAGIMTKSFGNFLSDYSVPPADYTGDGRADFVAVRQQSTAGAPQIWYINNSVTNVTTATAFGRSDPTFEEVDDTPVRGDYDGDRRHDIAIYRTSNRTFYYISTANNGSFQGQEAGLQDEIPLASFGLY